jgi:sugar/nucleoside kinase (ribokinase family)
MSLRKFGLCGLGNSLVDVFAHVSEEKFVSLGLMRGGMQLVSSVEQADLLASLGEGNHGNHPQVSGGSVANSVYAFAQLGGRAAFLTSLGNDERGDFYEAEFSNRGVNLPSPRTDKRPTGTSLVVVTPDAERTMSTDLGAAVLLDDSHIDREVIGASEWLFIEGYVFSNSEASRNAIRKAISYAKSSNTRVAVTLSEVWVIDAFRSSIEEVLPDVDLLFANEGEVLKFTRQSSIDVALQDLTSRVPGYAVTLGDRGAQVRFEGQTAEAAALLCQPVDLTGAGDMFAGALLYGLTARDDLHEAAQRACRMAGEVIQQTGARLPDGVFAQFVVKKAS